MPCPTFKTQGMPCQILRLPTCQLFDGLRAAEHQLQPLRLSLRDSSCCPQSTTHLKPKDHSENRIHRSITCEPKKNQTAFYGFMGPLHIPGLPLLLFPLQTFFQLQQLLCLSLAANSTSRATSSEARRSPNTWDSMSKEQSTFPDP